MSRMTTTAQPSGEVVSLRFGLGFDSQQIVGSVITADASSTAILLNCPSGTDSNDCGIYNISVTVGPWAAATPPPNLPSTGFYDTYMSMGSGSEPDQDGNEGFEFSQHCQVSITSQQAVPDVCTIVNIGGNNDGTPTQTTTFGSTDRTTLDLTPITITAGYEKLQAAASVTPTGASATGSSGTGRATGASSTGSSRSGSGTATGSGATSSQTGAASINGVTMRSLGLLTLLVAFFVR